MPVHITCPPSDWRNAPVYTPGELTAPDCSDAGSWSGPAGGSCAWVSALRTAMCLEATILDATGACYCQDPPACADCPDGSPDSWTVTLPSDGGGAYAGLAGTYTLTRTSGCIWESAGWPTGPSWRLDHNLTSDGWILTGTAPSGEQVFFLIESFACCGPNTCVDQPGADTSTYSGTSTVTLVAASACPPPNAAQRVILSSTDGILWSGSAGGGEIADCAYCPTGQAATYNVTLTLGTGDWTGCPTDWTLVRTPTDPCVWYQVQGDWGMQVVFGASGPSFIVNRTVGGTPYATYAIGETFTDCCATYTTFTKTAVIGSTPPDLNLLAPVGDCVSSGGGGGGNTASTFTICGVAYSAAFSKGGCDGPCLTLTSVTGSGATSYVGVRESCGPNWAVFAFGDAGICSGTTGCGGPAANVIRVKVQWIISCLWDGPGWYCVRDCGSEVACVATELLEGDQYDATIEICSGPYADEATAAAVCPRGEVVACGCGCISNERQKYFTVALAGITDGTCNECATGSNGTLLLTASTNSGQVCDWESGASADRCGGGNIRLRANYATNTLTAYFEYSIYSDAVYETSINDWDCKTTVTLPKVAGSNAPSPYCNTYPSSITVIPVPM